MSDIHNELVAELLEVVKDAINPFEHFPKDHYSIIIRSREKFHSIISPYDLKIGDDNGS